MTLVLVLIIFFAFQIFWNGFILSEVFHLAESKNLPFWMAWNQFNSENDWTGFKGWFPKCYYFVPSIIALVSSALAKLSTEKSN